MRFESIITLLNILNKHVARKEITLMEVDYDLEKMSF